MHLRYLILALLLTLPCAGFATAESSPEWEKKFAALSEYSGAPKNSQDDWLLNPDPFQTRLYRQGADELVLTNGLISRVFKLSPNAATVALTNYMTGESVLRAVKPEAKITLDGQSYDVGGLTGQPNLAYLLPEWKDKLQADPAAFQFIDFDTQTPEPRLQWDRKRWASDTQWPPRGVQLNMHYKLAASVTKNITVTIHYVMYDGLPAYSKWMTIKNDSRKTVRLDTFTNDILAAVEPASHVEIPNRWELSNIHLESEMSFTGMDPGSSDVTNHWVPDPDFETQVNYAKEAPLLMESRPPLGPDLDITRKTPFNTFRTFTLLFDSTETVRKTLSMNRFYRTVSPWATENPVMMHVRRSDPKAVKLAIDQSAAIGFEMVIMTFGSGFNMERTSPEYLDEIKGLVDYAHSKGIELGGYSLLASRKISEEHDVINPETGKTGGAYFGNSPCLGSAWGQEYFKKLYHFIEYTGLDLLEHDGSYPGDVCASTDHPGHRGLADSQWTQWKTISDFYKWCQGRGVYLNIPDWYFLSGSNKTAMGYRETNWSLPRAQQIIHGRQNMYDGTRFKTPSMGWMFVPLVEYHGGGATATLEPLKDHLDTYDAILAQNFGWGVQAAYRGPRLYDTPETQAVVKKWVDFNTKYRGILNADVIPLRRADGQDWDGILHVDPEGSPKGLAFFFNPLPQPIERTIRLPLYYTGLIDTAHITTEDGKPVAYTLNRDYTVDVSITIPANHYTWLIINE